MRCIYNLIVRDVRFGLCVPYLLPMWLPIIADVVAFSPSKHPYTSLMLTCARTGALRTFLRIGGLREL